MNTGENAEALRKITDLFRRCSILLLCLHFYMYCYSAFEQWGLTHSFVKLLLKNLGNTGLFNNFYITKAGALGLLIISLLGSKGKKDERIKVSYALRQLFIGLVLYSGSFVLLNLAASVVVLGGMYIAITAVGYLLLLQGGALLTRIIKQRLDTDIFNQLQETFPQEERLLENEYSINLPARYNLKGKIRKSFINIINPFRALLVAGTPGS